MDNRIFRRRWSILGACVVALCVACKTENDPEYWIDKLEQPSARAAVLTDIERRLEQELQKANADAKNSFRDRMLAALSEFFSEHYDELDSETRVRLLDLATLVTHPEAPRAIEKSLEGFSKGKAGVPEIEIALDAALEASPGTVGTPLLSAFQRFEVGTNYALTQKLQRAMVRHAKPAWRGPLLASLKAPIILSTEAKNQEDTTQRQNEMFRQSTAVEVLGAIGGDESVESLLKVLLDANKEELHMPTILSLLRIGPPALRRASRLLSNDADPLAVFAKEHEPKQKFPGVQGQRHVLQAALLLGESKHVMAREPLLAAVKGAKTAPVKALLARELSKAPASPETIEAYKNAFDSLPEDAAIPPGISAQDAIAEAAINFFDPTLVPWLVDRANAIEEEDDPARIKQNSAMASAIRLMTIPQIELVQAVIMSRKSEIETDAFARTAALIRKCNDLSSCFISAISAEENQSGKDQVLGVKAATMLAILGNDQTRNVLVQRYERIKSPVIRFAVTQAIDHLSRKGGADVAGALAKVLERAERRPNAQRDIALELVRWRVAARSAN